MTTVLLPMWISRLVRKVAPAPKRCTECSNAATTKFGGFPMCSSCYTRIHGLYRWQRYGVLEPEFEQMMRKRIEEDLRLQGQAARIIAEYKNA